MAMNSLSNSPNMKIGKTISTLANTRFIEGSWLVLKSSAPLYLRCFGAGPFQIIKRIKRRLFLRGQQDFQLTVADALKYFDPAPDIKISR